MAVVRGDALLAGWAGALAAGDLRGAAIGAGEEERPWNPGLTQVVPAPHANELRPWEVCRDLFCDLLARDRGMVAPRRTLRLKNKPLSLDATVINLWLSLFP